MAQRKVTQEDRRKALQELALRIDVHLRDRDELMKLVAGGQSFETIFGRVNDHINEISEITGMLYLYADRLAEEAKRKRKMLPLEAPPNVESTQIRLLTDQLLAYHGDDMEQMRLAPTYTPEQFSKSEKKSRDSRLTVIKELRGRLR